MGLSGLVGVCVGAGVCGGEEGLKIGDSVHGKGARSTVLSGDLSKFGHLHSFMILSLGFKMDREKR